MSKPEAKRMRVWISAVFKRRDPVVFTTMLAGLALPLILATMLSIRFGTWGNVVNWVVARGLFGMSLWAMLLAALLATGPHRGVWRMAL